MKPYKFTFTEKESKLTIISELEDAIVRAKNAFYSYREILEEYVTHHEQFLTSFSPVQTHSEHEIIERMSEAASIFDVGPMAAVAGALADLMLEAMKYNEHVKNLPKIALVENGGEIIIDSEKPMKVALYAGNNQLNFNLGFLIEKKDMPMGIGTSSATVGHAISLGEADAVTIFAKNAAYADAAATKIANAVKGNEIENSIKTALDKVNDYEDVYGAFISRGDQVGRVGKVPKLIKLTQTPQINLTDEELMDKMNNRIIE